jgi:hypothetical protein
VGLKPSAALVPLALLAAGCGGGGKPHFESAAGWHVLSRSGELAAANVPFAASDDPGLESPPSRTVATLARSGVVIWAMVSRDMNSDFPSRRLPLRVAQGQRSNPFEGFPCAPAVTTSRCYAASGSIRHLEARSGSHTIDLYIFFGRDRPSRAQIAAADAELARLSL